MIRKGSQHEQSSCRADGNRCAHHRRSGYSGAASAALPLSPHVIDLSASYVESFYSGLGVQPQDSWSTTTSQYGDGAGFPTFSGSVFAGAWQDTSAPPFGATQEPPSAEAEAF